ncbi:MAG: WecB/TagA/CpsF family glycosyltransferase [Dermatophilaceae bacterium]
MLNATFDRCTLDSCVDEVLASAAGRERVWLATVNVAILMAMRRSRELHEYAGGARWVVADGQPIVWLSRLLGRPLPQRVTGVDLIDRLCARAEEDGLGVYFLGASDEVVTAAGRAMKVKYPRLRLHVANGYFTAAQAPERVSAVADSGVSLLFVGMGVPRQEQFISKHMDALNVNVAIGVGGSFDVIGGLRDRAPLALQKLGLEWTYRLAQEPRRLWRRYLVTGMQFLILALAALALEGLRVARRQP